MKKLLVLVFALIAVIGMVFAINAADAEKLTGLADVSKIYKADGSEIVGGGMNGGSYMHHLFDGSYGACYNNNVGSYIITDLNAKLPGGYYVTEIKIYHSNNSKFSLYYTTDGVNWKPIVENAQTTEATYAVGETAVQVKYVFTTCANWVASAKEIEIYGIDPSELECLHSNLSADGWTPVPGSATCTGVGSVSQACPDCGEVQVQISNDVLPLGHDLITTVTRPGTSVSYGAATLNCSRCDYTIDFSGEVNLTSSDYCSIGESQQFTNVLVSSIADLWGASTVENLFKGDWDDVGPFHTWVAAGEDDVNEYVLLNFQGEIDLTKIKIQVQNDSGGTLVLSALDSETGEYEVVKELQTYDANISGGGTLVMEVPMLGITTSSLKIQVFSNWRNANGYYYNRMVIGELEAHGIAKGCGLDADNHECVFDTFVEYKTAPTCIAAGEAIYKCACNATTVKGVEASEEFHNYVEVEGTRVNSTCTVAGSYTGKCEYCEAETTISLDVDGENGHAYEEIGRTDADCVNAGSIEYKCANCEATKTEEIPALGHTYGEAVVVPSTCKENGTSTKTCTVCGNEEVTTLETTGCTWEVDSIITEPTCAAEGEANYVCSVCGETKVDVVPATGNHTWDEANVEITLAPTCDMTGAGNYTCTVCGKVEKKTVPATGHNWVDATCTAPKTCLNCNKTEGEALPHSAGEFGWEPSCTGVGRCGTCGAEFGEIQPHSWSETPWVDSATCIAEGKTYYYCSNCWAEDESRTEYSPIDTENGHQPDWNGPKEEVLPTCSAAGYTLFDCGLCGAIDVRVELPADPTTYHEAMDWEGNYTNLTLDVDTYVELTCQSAGYAKYVCSVCNNYEAVVTKDFVEGENHVWGEGVAIEGGLHYECDLCDASKDEITQGTFDDAIVANDGDNTLVYYATGYNYVVYQITLEDKGTITVTTDSTAGVFIGFEYEYEDGWYNVGETSYSYEASSAGDYYIVFSLDGETYTVPETFNVSVVLAVYPELPLGETTMSLEEWTNYECVVTAPGRYSMTVGENTEVILPNQYGFTTIEQYPYEFTVNEGDKVKFMIRTADFMAGEVSVTLTNPDNALLDGTYTDGMESAFFVFDNGTLTVTDADAMNPSGFAGTYTYNYNSVTGALVLDPNTLPLTVNAYTGEILVYGRMPLAKYVAPIELVMGENAIEVTDTWNGTKTVVTTPGSYILSAPEGTTPNVMVEIANSASAIEQYPYEFTVAEGEKVKFVVFDSTTLTLSEKPNNSALNGVYVESQSGAMFTFADGNLTIVDANPMMPTGFAGEYTYNYYESTGSIVLDPAIVNMYVADGTIYVQGRMPMPLSAYVPPAELVIGDNTIEVTDTWNGTKVVVSVAGTYTLYAPEGTTPLVMFEAVAGHAVQIAEYPFEFTVEEGLTVTFVVLESTTLTLSDKPAHTHEYTAVVTDPTCTTDGFTTYTCEGCGDTYTDNYVDALGHSEVEIPMVRPTPTVTGYTAGSKCATCGVTTKAPVAINVTLMSSEKDENGKYLNNELRVASATLTLSDNIAVQYSSIVAEGYNNPYMVFVFRGDEYVVTDYTINTSNGRYQFRCKETRPHFMNENIAAYVYAETAEGEYSVHSISEYSIKQYCITQLKKNDPKLTTVISDVLTLGAMTQIRESYRTDALITNVIEDAGYTLTPTKYNGVDSKYMIQSSDVVTGDRATGTDWKSATLVLGSATQLQYKFVTDNIEGLTVKVQVGNDTRVFDSTSFEYDNTTKRYSIKLDYITVLQFGSSVTATFERDGVQVGSTITYTINAYLYSNCEKTSHSEADRNLMKAIYVYGQTISAYNGNK